MTIFLILLLWAAPLSAQEPAPAAPAVQEEGAVSRMEMPPALAEAPLMLESEGRIKSYETNVGALFLNKKFRTIRVSDGSERTFAYRQGELQREGFYMLPIEMRSSGRLRSIFKYYFSFEEGGNAYLVRWEEINFVGRQVLQYTAFQDLDKGVSFFQSMLPLPEKAFTPPADPVQDPPAENTNS